MKKRLILTIGVSGSGKSTYVASLQSKYDYIVISSDKLRAVIGSDETDQSCNREVFLAIKTFVRYFLRYDFRHVVVDATSYSIKNRKDIIEAGRAEGAIIEAVYFDIPIEVAKQRNRDRSRQVPEDVIDRQFNGLVMPTEDEVDALYIVDVSCSSPKVQFKKQ